MKIQGKQNIEYMVTKTQMGQIVRVFQIDPIFRGELNDKDDPLTIPILVSYLGSEESLVYVLLEREELKKKIKDLEQKLDNKTSTLNSYWIEAIEQIQRKLRINKHWWEFWK